MSAPISVTDDITPISKKPINQIDSHKWLTMSMSDLIDQRIYLQTRLNMVASASGDPNMLQAMHRGLQELDGRIQAKQIQEQEQESNNNKQSGLI